MQAHAEISDSGANLLARIAEGNETALQDFYQAYHARVYAFAVKRLNNPTDAADVLNEVMFEVWRNAARFEGRSQPLTWVLGIAHHKVCDCLRRRGARPETEEIDGNLADEDDVSALDALAGAEDAERVRRCLEELSDAHRQVIHLAFYDDLPYPEIARIVDCPVGTVKTRVFHAKQLLKRCLSRVP